MSTRSGKRIHSSFHDNTTPDVIRKSERKTRGRNRKENKNESDESVVKAKKRNNYVKYPTDDDDDMLVDATAQNASEAPDVKPTRKLRRNTLKNHNSAEPLTEIPKIHGDANKVIRLTRHTKKFAENGADGATDMPENGRDAVIPNEMVKAKKGKKKTKSQSVVDQVNSAPVTQKSKKKKKGKRSRELIEVEIVKKVCSMNKSNTSTDSYYSAAGSPLIENNIDNVLIKNDNKSVMLIEAGPTEVNEDLNETFTKEIKRISSISTFDKIDHDTTMVPNDLNATFDKSEKEVTDRLNATFEKPTKTIDPIAEIVVTEKEKLHLSFQKRSRQSSSEISESENLNASFEKTNRNNSKTSSLNSTYDKNTVKKLDNTSDKTQIKSNSAKSSLISTDNTINVTFDKSDNSRISITSDESRTENIVNTTPLLIESSLEDSRISDNLSTTINLNRSQKDTKKVPLTASVIPLKRESTFTKEGPDKIITSPKTRFSSEITPTKSILLPLPGFTPFHVTRSSRREKSLLNVTRSIEKPTRWSSLADLAPRQTKVMFCSPMNNPGVATQQKKKVIKSSLKGSNKSFVFDESVSDSRPAGRKRSHTSDAELPGAKRTRLAEALQLSVERLSRPRTSSAAAKLTDITPKKTTPAKSTSKPSRTKLPNFAALHQKEFARMESLNECQERKAKRAKELLTPRSKSVKGTTEKFSQKPAASTAVTKRPLTSANSSAVTRPTLESLRSGFTKFGFRLPVDVNPFSVPIKTTSKARENRPNGLTRHETLSSIKGAADRKEAAKQVIMREKSFTSLSNKREVTRKQDRTVIKGVRTNRRFELQMQMRNIN